LARIRRAWAETGLGIVLLAVMLAPVYWVCVSALKTGTQIFHTPPYLVPPTPTLSAFSAAWHVLSHYMVNSGVIAIGAVILTLLLGAPAAFGIAHLRLRLTPILVLVLLISQMFPSVMLATPLFILFNRIGLVNTYIGLIFANATNSLPFVILVLRAYLLTVPHELTEAAQVDGTGLFGAFWRVIVPTAASGMATAALFTFLFAWNDFTFGLTLTTGTDIQPVSLGLYNFMGQYTTQWNNLMAGAVLAALPAVIILLAAQRFVTAGLTAGAVKG
jgi:multiple sugar transport system permease protein